MNFHKFSFIKFRLFLYSYTFTLVELLIVIAVIMILSSLLLPALKKARENANASICLSNQKQIGSLIYLYSGDYNGFTPPSRGVWPNHWPYYLYSNGYVSEPLRGSKSIFVCPNSPPKVCPPLPTEGYRAYGMRCAPDNTRVAFNIWGNLRDDIGNAYNVSPSSFLIIFDSYSSAYKSMNAVGYRSEVCVIHSKSVNGLFVDGHVDNLTVSELSEQQGYFLSYFDNFLIQKPF